MSDQSKDIRPSFKGRLWEVQEPVTYIQRDLERRGLPTPVAKILSARGIKSADLDDYLEPTIRKSLPDPSNFKDMDVGVAHIADDMQAGRKITIWSDYDCDGVTSAATLKRFFRIVGFGEVDVRIPDRITEGYGPNANGMREVKADGADTVCILDAGIVAFEALEAAQEVGLNVVVIDHHAAEEKLPPAVAVINANRLDEAPGYGHLCAAGMVFEFCVGLARELNKRGWFDGQEGRPSGTPQEAIMSLLDIVALGTVADVVPLTTLNRAFVARGLEFIDKGGNPGLRQLALVAGKKPGEKAVAKDLGWKFGPRINAGGRIDDAMIGVHLLTTDDPAEAAKLAKRLDDINAERKGIEEKVTEPAIEQFHDRTPGEDRRIAIAVVDDAHEGVVGISAGRVKEAYDCPAIVLAKDHEGNYKGSARSVKGFDIGHAIIDARNAGLILKGGGHGMAGGLTLTPEQLEPFEAFMNAEIEKSDYFRDGVSTEVDVVLQPAELTVDLIDSFNRMEPFGTANPAPRVVLEGAEIKEIRILKEKHLKVTLVAGKGTIDGLMWGVVGSHMGDFLQNSIGHKIDVYGEPGINEFRGNRSAQMVIDDIREHEGSLL
jgi:single-stranded-DNA-specific exonuclease